MQNNLWPLIFAALFFGCSNLETVENKTDEGILLEKYSRRKDTFAKQGQYLAFYPNGQVAEQSWYENDTLNGERKLFYESGKIESVEHQVMGRFEGVYQHFYENGQLSNEGQYANNEMTGIWKRWYDSGELMEEVTFAHNNENGPFKLYYKNGQVQVEGNYISGDNDHGELKQYSESGEHITTMFCHYGVCATTWSVDKGDIKIDSARIIALGELNKSKFNL
ncbi:MAG: toxin-antitoxin system YwqK family antitoxin [Saprospiraceae bacterium]